MPFASETLDDAKSPLTAPTTSWIFLACFAFHGFWNQFIFMDFAGVPAVTNHIFGGGEAGVNSLYSAALASSAFSILFCMTYMRRAHTIVTVSSVTATVVSSWLRWIAVYTHMYSVAVGSSLFLGAGVGCIVVGFTEYPRRWFCTPQTRAVAPAVGVQLSFFGWAVGGFVLPILIQTSEQMNHCLLVQALVTSLCLPAWCLVLLHESPLQAEVDMDTSENGLSELISSMLSMVTNLRYVVVCTSCSLLQGIAYTIPAVLATPLQEAGYTSLQSAWSAFVFIASGVFVGITAGSVSGGNVRLQGSFALVFFWLAAFTISAMHIACTNPPSFLVVCALMTISGGASMGVLNMALPLASDALPIVPQEHSESLVVLSAFVVSFVLCELSVGQGFLVCAITAFVCAGLFTLSVVFSSVRDELTPLVAKHGVAADEEGGLIHQS